MKTKHFQVIHFDEARDRALPGTDCYYGDPYGYLLYRLNSNSDPVEFIGDDISEPEDKSLMRDFKWIVPALENEGRRAFELGWEAHAEWIRGAGISEEWEARDSHNPYPEPPK